MRKRFNSALLAVAISLAGLATPASAQPASDAEESDYVMSTEVDLVVLDVSVVDRKGRYVFGLDESVFRVFEEEEPQEIELFRKEDAPVTAGILIDASSSMRKKRLETARAARAFVDGGVAADELFVMHFNERVRLSMPPGNPFSADKDLIKASLGAASVGGQTALYDAVVAALEHSSRGRHQRKALLVFSDGGDNASRHDLDFVKRRLEESKATAYLIGLFDARDPDRNPGVLKKLAKISGGQAHFPKQMDQVIDICREIAREIRARYTIGYTPSRRGREGDFRDVKVVVAAAGDGPLTARTRPGYRVPSLPR